MFKAILLQQTDDKKTRAGAIRFVVIEAPGRAGVRAAADSVVAQVLDAHTR